MPLIAVSATRTRVAMHREMAVTTNKPAKIASLVVGGLVRKRGEIADAEKRIVRRKRGAHAAFASDVFPAPLREETMIAAGDEFGSVLEHDSEGLFRRLPAGDHLRSDVSPVPSSEDRAVNHVALPEIPQPHRQTVAAKNRRIA